MEALVMQATNELESEFASPDANLAIVRPTDIRVGIRANGFYDNYFVQAIWTPISLKDDIGGHQVSLSVRRDWQIKNLNLYASLGALYLSDEITNFYYGVSPSLSQDIINVLQIPPEDTRTTAFFSPFDANGGTVFSTQVGFEYPLSEHWVAGGVFSLQRLPNAIDDSPIGTFRQYNSVTALSLTYVF
jgi:outer membrane scaffolding protein for murein synthesis (MipA/OmpV family)